MSRPSRRLWRRALVTLALILVTGWGVGIGCADRPVLAPSPDHRDAGEAIEQRLPFQGGRLQIWIARSPGVGAAEPRAFLLEFCGNGTRAEDIAAYLAKRWGDRPIEVWAVNYPGYGGSTGPPRLRTMTTLAVGAFDELKRRAGDRPIFVEGFSLGTVPALALAARRPVAGAVLQNGPPLRQLIVGHHGWWNLWLLAWPVAMQIPRDCDSVANARAATAPAVFVIADHDQTVPPKYQRMIADAYGGPQRVVMQANADHVTPLTDRDEAKLQEALDWLWSTARK
jgi:pimeloyl-ACP methyl ester carboxylesterase